jgi:hypothetical protein
MKFYRIAHIFQTKINEGDALSKKAKNPKTYFCAKGAPGLSIKDYLTHLIKHLRTPPAALILMMIYVERLLQSLSNAINASGSAYPYLLTSFNAHRIILTALVIAHKYSMDVAYPFSILAKVVGVSVSELKILESEFLFFVKYELYVSQDLYEKYEDLLQHWSQLPTILQEMMGETEEQEEPVSMPIEDDEDLAPVAPKKEESKEIDEFVAVRRRVDKVRLTDEEYVNSIPDHIVDEKPNPASRHEKPVVDATPSSTIQNLDVRSHFYEDDPEENSDDEDEDTEMTIVDEDDLGDDEFEEDVILY